MIRRLLEKYKLFYSVDRQDGLWLVGVYHTELPELLIHSAVGRLLWVARRRALFGAIRVFSQKLRDLKNSGGVDLKTCTMEGVE